MGKPVKPASSGRALQRQEKRPREPSPPSSESEKSDISAASEASSEAAGQDIPALDFALLAKLRVDELNGSFKALAAASPEYRKLLTQQMALRNQCMLETLQPEITSYVASRAVAASKGGASDVPPSFYQKVFDAAFEYALKNQLQSMQMKLTTIGMRYAQIEAEKIGKTETAGKIFVPYTVDDIIPFIRPDDGDEIFTDYMTGMTTTYLAEESEAVKTSEAFHAVEYTMYFAPGNPAFKNNQLRLRIFVEGGALYRTAEVVLGRIVDIHADKIEWTSADSEKKFLSEGSPFAWFRAFFSGHLPTCAPAESPFRVPRGHSVIRTALEKHLGTLIGLPAVEVAHVDLMLLEQLFEAVEADGVALDTMWARDPNKKQAIEDEVDDDAEDDDDMDVLLPAQKLSKYLERIRHLGSKADGLSAAEELDVVRHVVMVDAQLHFALTQVLTREPLKILANAGFEDEGDIDDDEDDEEWDEGDEEDEEEVPAQKEKQKSSKGDSGKAPQKQPECKQQ